MQLRLALIAVVLPFALVGCDAEKKADQSPRRTVDKGKDKDKAKAKTTGEAGETPKSDDAGPPPPGEPEQVDPPPAADSGLLAELENESGEAESGEAETEAPKTPAAGGPFTFEAIDAREESLVPSETAADRQEAYLALPVKRGDGKPIGAIGPEGTHLDDFVIGRGFSEGRCEEAADTFFPDGEDDRVNVCLRIVHKPQEETVTVNWVKEGRPPRATKVTVKPIHAFRTRAYLPLKGHRKGNWEAIVEAEDGTELARGSFTVK